MDLFEGQLDENNMNPDDHVNALPVWMANFQIEDLSEGRLMISMNQWFTATAVCIWIGIWLLFSQWQEQEKARTEGQDRPESLKKMNPEGDNKLQAGEIDLIQWNQSIRCYMY